MASSIANINTSSTPFVQTEGAVAGFDSHGGQYQNSPRDSMNNLQKNAKSKITGVGKKQKGGKNQYGNNKQSKKQIEEQLKKQAEDSKANSYFSCNCQVCKTQVSKGHRFEIKRTMNLSLLQGKKLQFSKLIEYMLPPNEKVKGCQVLFPDTVFFGHGKPQFIAKCDREGCLMIIQQQSKLALQDIRQKFSTIVRERKKETQPIVFQVITNIGSSVPSNQNGQGNATEGVKEKGVQLQHQSPKAKSSINQNLINDEEGNGKNNDEKSIFYKDTAVFRFIVDDINNQMNGYSSDQDEQAGFLKQTSYQYAAVSGDERNQLSNGNINNLNDANTKSHQTMQLQDQQSVNPQTSSQMPFLQSQVQSLNSLPQQIQNQENFSSQVFIQSQALLQPPQQPNSQSQQQQPQSNQTNDEGNFQMAAVKVVRDTEFINEFRRRANDEFWKTIDCIQTSIKAKTGIGHPIFVNFMAPINEADPLKEIDYSHFKVMQDDTELLKQEEDDLFCYKQCLKIAYYVSKVYNYEILQMKAEFLKDENGNIWFFYSSNIQVRPSRNRTSSAYNMKNSASQKANQQKEQLIAEIEQYESEQNVQQNKSIGRMLNIMDSYYTSMKSDMGIFQKQDFSEEDSKLDEVLRTLRPNTTANNFKEFLSRQDNITRSTHWKSIARKVVVDEDNQNGKCNKIMLVNNRQKQSQSRENNNTSQFFLTNAANCSQPYYMSKRTMSQDSRKIHQIQSLIHALDVSSLGTGNNGKGKDPSMKTKELMKVLTNMNRSTNLSTSEGVNGNGTAVPYGITQTSAQKSVHLLGQTHRSFFHYSGPYQNENYGGIREQRSNFKAELVRNELLSRSDLMKLYQPPLKKSQLPTNNPFYTKTIVQVGRELQPQLNLSQFKGNIITDKPYEDEMSSNQDLLSSHSKISPSSYQLNHNYTKKSYSSNQPLRSTKFPEGTPISLNNVGMMNHQNPLLNYKQQQLVASFEMNNNVKGSTIKSISSSAGGAFNRANAPGGISAKMKGEDIEQQSVLSYSQNGSSLYNHNNKQINQSHTNMSNFNTNSSGGAAVMVNWSAYQGTQKLARQITKRMEYLKLTETFAAAQQPLPHQEI